MLRAVKDSRASYNHGRTLVICLDGTGDKFDSDNSNVVNFVACLKKAHPLQVTYYQSGIGTYGGGRLKGGFSAAMDMAVGSSLGLHIKGAYRFLMQNYREGDKICLLGFSRGAYTVRCLAGMLHKVGLLPPHNRSQVDFAYQFYKDDTPEGWNMSGQFKKAFCENVEVDFVGVWDCVASVGFFPRKLPFSKSPTNTIGCFRHAMALDEHRAKFKVLQYLHNDPAADARAPKTSKAKMKAKKNEELGRIRRMPFFGSKPKLTAKGTTDKRSSTSSATSTTHLNKFEEEIKKHEGDKDKQQELLEKQFDKENPTEQHHRQTDVLEVWFAGCHADVGGGAVPNEERHMLSRVPLRWMIRQCFECDTGILFDTAALAETGIDVQTLWPVYIPQKKPVVGPSPTMVEKYESGALPPLQRRSTALDIEKDKRKVKKEADVPWPARDTEAERSRLQRDLALLPEQVEDHFDAMEPINDQLVQAKGWWVLEFWPVKVRIQKKGTDEWRKVVRMNLGRFRGIREIEPKMHWTVQTRIRDHGYKIRNRLDKDAIWQIHS